MSNHLGQYRQQSFCRFSVPYRSSGDQAPAIESQMQEGRQPQLLREYPMVHKRFMQIQKSATLSEDSSLQILFLAADQNSPHNP